MNKLDNLPVYASLDHDEGSDQLVWLDDVKDKTGYILYTLWDKNVEKPNQTEYTQYNKGYLHGLAHVKKQLLGGDNFPGDLADKEKFEDRDVDKPEYVLTLESEEEIMLLLNALGYARENAVTDSSSIKLGDMHRKVRDLEKLSKGEQN